MHNYFPAIFDDTGKFAGNVRINLIAIKTIVNIFIGLSSNGILIRVPGNDK